MNVAFTLQRQPSNSKTTGGSFVFSTVLFDYPFPRTTLPNSPRSASVRCPADMPGCAFARRASGHLNYSTSRDIAIHPPSPCKTSRRLNARMLNFCRARRTRKKEASTRGRDSFTNSKPPVNASSGQSTPRAGGADFLVVVVFAAARHRRRGLLRLRRVGHRRVGREHQPRD